VLDSPAGGRVRTFSRVRPVFNQAHNG